MADTMPVFISPVSSSHEIGNCSGAMPALHLAVCADQGAGDGVRPSAGGNSNLTPQ